MSVGQRVVVIASWSSFRGSYGEIRSVDPLMVRIDGESHDMRFGDTEVVAVSETSHLIAGD